MPPKKPIKGGRGEGVVGVRLPLSRSIQKIQTIFLKLSFTMRELTDWYRDRDLDQLGKKTDTKFQKKKKEKNRNLSNKSR